MKFWITNYALSQGIIVLEAGEPEGTILKDPRPENYNYYYGEGRQWHRTEAGAVKRANEMVQTRIACLEKQLRKLRGMHFTVKDQP